MKIVILWLIRIIIHLIYVLMLMSAFSEWLDKFFCFSLTTLLSSFTWFLAWLFHKPRRNVRWFLHSARRWQYKSTRYVKVISSFASLRVIYFYFIWFYTFPDTMLVIYCRIHFWFLLNDLKRHTIWIYWRNYQNLIT